MQYRSEIDGLRAVAVIPVILFHAGFEQFSGGFVGVDVFFVISGYLITTIILSEKEKGTFSLGKFYERRARRILPALFLVMTASLPFAWLWLLPNDMEDFAQSLIAVSLFSSNILFWQESGYFAVAAELKPLLHTWSLAVEEQYYVLFPLFLSLVWAYRKRWVFGAIVGLGLVSLALAQWGAYAKPEATFFLLPTRAWELMMGGSVAFLLFYGKLNITSIRNNRMFSEALGFSGLALIAYSVAVFDHTIPFPSLYALVPTLGTALVIFFAHSATYSGRLLANRALVGIGLISYSAYLWHQPLFAFARHRSAAEAGSLIYLILSCIAILLAYFSWKFVESPFRNRASISRRALVGFSVIGSVFFLGIGLAGHLSNGFEGRFSSDQMKTLAFENYDKEALYREKRCFLQPDQTFLEFAPECASTENGGKTYLLWGDSHAAALYSGLAAQLEGLGQYTASGCPPLEGFVNPTRPHCAGIVAFVLDQIEELQPDTLIMHANWIYAFDFSNNLRLAQTLKRIAAISPGTEVFVVGSVPQWKPSLPKRLIRGDAALTTETFLPLDDWMGDDLDLADMTLSADANEVGATFISPRQHLCEDAGCLAVTKDEAGYSPTAWDYGHFTRAGSHRLGEQIGRFMDIPGNRHAPAGANP